MGHDYPYARLLYVRPGQDCSTDEMFGLVRRALHPSTSVRRDGETITVSEGGAYMTITRDTGDHVPGEAAFFSSKTPGLNAEGSTVCFNVSGFDPDIVLCIEPSQVSLSVWLTGKFVMLDMRGGGVLDFEEEMVDNCRSVLIHHPEGLRRKQFVGLFQLSPARPKYLSEAFLIDFLSRVDTFVVDGDQVRLA